MAKRKKSPHNKPARRPKTKRSTRSVASRREHREPELMDDVARALDVPGPLELLMMVSPLLAALDPRSRGPLGRRDAEPQLTVNDFVQTLIEVPTRETTACLSVFAALIEDDLLVARIRRELAARRFVLPDWLVELGAVTPRAPVEVSHVLGDGSSVLLGARFGGGHELTAVVLVDHNAGSVAKDAFVIGDSIEAAVRQMVRAAGSDPDTSIAEVDAAATRARLAEAVKFGAMTYPPYETETWPACRPIVEWLIAALPPGGVGYERREWSDAELAALTERFFASPYGRPLDSHGARSLLDSLLWYGWGYGIGDPLRWSGPRVETLLLDWIPRKIVAPAEELAGAPEVLRALIRFGHAELGIRDELTTEVLGDVDQFEDEYRTLIATPRPQGPMALLAAMGAIDPDGPWGEADSWQELALEGLWREVGGPAALAALDDAPLPAEQFDWTGIAEDVEDTVREVLDLLDGVVTPVLGFEYRTACRRLLHRVAVGDPAVFRRKARAQISAAALCWIVARANRRFDAGPDQMMVKDLLAEFGVTGSVSQRAKALLGAGGFDQDTYELALGTPDLLVSARRRQIREARDRLPNRS